MIVDRVTESLECLLQVFFEQEASMIGANGDAHDTRLYYGFKVQRSGLKVLDDAVQRLNDEF